MKLSIARVLWLLLAAISAVSQTQPKKIIIDTDPGTDDALAILLALNSPEVQVEAITAGAHLHARRGCPRNPHGQGFIAATSCTRAGRRTEPRARTSTTSPLSSGWRSASSTLRENSGSSSRKSTP